MDGKDARVGTTLLSYFLWYLFERGGRPISENAQDLRLSVWKREEKDARVTQRPFFRGTFGLVLLLLCLFPWFLRVFRAASLYLSIGSEVWVGLLIRMRVD